MKKIVTMLVIFSSIMFFGVYKSVGGKTSDEHKDYKEKQRIIENFNRKIEVLSYKEYDIKDIESIKSQLRNYEIGIEKKDIIIKLNKLEENIKNK